jgi:hypothetical protein
MSVITHPYIFICPKCWEPAFHRSRIPEFDDPVSNAAEAEHLNGSPCLSTDPYVCESCGQHFDWLDMFCMTDRWRYIWRCK